MKKRYALVYYYPNQSKLFSSPQVHFCETEAQYTIAMQIAAKNDYEVVCSGSLKMMSCVLAAANMLEEVL